MGRMYINEDELVTFRLFRDVIVQTTRDAPPGWLRFGATCYFDDEGDTLYWETECDGFYKEDFQRTYVGEEDGEEWSATFLRERKIVRFEKVK